MPNIVSLSPRQLWCHVVALLSVLFLTACAKDYNLVGTEREKGGTPIWLSANVRVHNTRAISNATADDDTKIYSLRLIISDSQTGKVVYNEKTTTLSGVEDKYSQPAGETSVWRKPFQIIPGDYDFWFIANEGQNWYAPNVSSRADKNAAATAYNQALDRLAVGTDIARIFDGKVFADATQQPLSHLDLRIFGTLRDATQNRQVMWWPDATRPMPMSAVYRNVTINSTRNGKGATEDDPQHFIANGDELVELVRCFAKVTLNFERATLVKNLRGIFPEALRFPFFGDFGVTILNRPRYWSYFNTPYFEMNHTPRAFNFYSDIFPEGEARYRYERLAIGKWNYPSNNTWVHLPTSPDVTYTNADLSANDNDLKDYRYTFYVPEMLLEKGTLDGNANGGVAERWDRSLLISLFKPGHTMGTGSDLTPPLQGDEFPFGSQSAFKSALDQTTYFSIGQQNINEDAPTLGGGQRFELPNAERYSRFSLLRNHHYVYNIRERERLQVDVRIAPWEEEVDNSRRYVFQDFQIWVEDPTFSNTSGKTRIRIQATTPTSDMSHIRLALLNNEVDYGSYRDGGNVNEKGAIPGKANQQVFFSGYGNQPTMAKINGNANFNQAVVEMNKLRNQNYQEFTIEWGSASTANRPTQDRAVLRVQWYRGGVSDAQEEQFSRQSNAFIFALPGNWKSRFPNGDLQN